MPAAQALARPEAALAAAGRVAECFALRRAAHLVAAVVASYPEAAVAAGCCRCSDAKRLSSCGSNGLPIQVFLSERCGPEGSVRSFCRFQELATCKTLAFFAARASRLSCASRGAVA